MGEVVMHELPWSEEDADGARELPQAEREKLKGLDYRVRKTLAHYRDVLIDTDNCKFGQRHVVFLHKQDAPESLDRLRLEAGRFMLNLSKRCSDEIVVRRNVPDVHFRRTFRGGPRGRFRPHPFRDMQRMPGIVEAKFWFEIGDTWHDGSDFVPLFLYMSAQTCPRQSIMGRNNGGAWEVPGFAAYARSASFVDGVDAEVEGCVASEPKRWWCEREHARQGAQHPLNERVVNPSGPHADVIAEGGVVLDLKKCSTVPRLPLMHPWKACGVTHSSARALWAFLGNGSNAAIGALQSVRCCPELGQQIAAFVLEPDAFEFEADVMFGLALACM